MIIGTIEKWFDEKRFGFIRPDDPDFSETFVHLKSLPNGVCPVEGLRVAFDIAPPLEERNARGKGGIAVNVRAV